MPLGTEVGIGTGHIVLDGDPLTFPYFSAYVCCANRSPIPATAEHL